MNIFMTAKTQRDEVLRYMGPAMASKVLPVVQLQPIVAAGAAELTLAIVPLEHLLANARGDLLPMFPLGVLLRVHGLVGVSALAIILHVAQVRLDRLSHAIGRFPVQLRTLDERFVVVDGVFILANQLA